MSPRRRRLQGVDGSLTADGLSLSYPVSAGRVPKPTANTSAVRSPASTVLTVHGGLLVAVGALVLRAG